MRKIAAHEVFAHVARLPLCGERHAHHLFCVAKWLNAGEFCVMMKFKAAIHFSRKPADI